MSRSYKKSPICGDKSKSWVKKQFNRNLRHKNKMIDPEDESNYLPNSSYKKANQSWHIKDVYYRETWEEYWEECVSRWIYFQHRGIEDPYPDEKEEYKRWYK